MQIVMAQINPTVNHMEENAARVKQVITEAPVGSLIMFPEMVINGYPLEDLALDRGVQETTADKMREIVSFMATLNGERKTAVIGHLLGSQVEGARPYNAVSVISTEDGLITTKAKIALPTYGVFDEGRLFASGDDIAIFQHEDEKVGILICEDAWDVSKGAITQLEGKGITTALIINGSPYETAKTLRRYQVVKNILDTTSVRQAAYVNLVGGQDDLVFDGASFIMNSDGQTHTLPAFKEEVAVLTFAEANQPTPPLYTEDELLETDYNAIVFGVREYLRKNHMKSVLLGVSGGIDSAIVATIAADAIGGENVFGISMPSAYSSEGSVTDAELLMQNIGGNYRQIPIKGLFDEFMNGYVVDGIAEENLQARLRGTILMSVSNQEGHLVLAPGNKSEIAVGYSTIYGDSVGGYAPIKDVYKTRVYALAKWRNSLPDAPIPPASISKVPSAELRPGQVDQESLPDYPILDSLLTDMIEGRMPVSEMESKHGAELTQDILRKVNRAEWKRRQYAVGPKISTMSFGRERMVPITR